MKRVIIAPSILAADFAQLGAEITKVIAAGADWIHVDVMDNHYVPNLTLGPMVCKAIKPYCNNIPIDVHLMAMPVDSLIEEFAAAGADIISFHPEASFHVDRSINLIKSLGVKAGLALNPATPLNCLDYVLDKLDVIVLMSVNPGFGGQTFMPAILDKIKQAKNLIANNERRIIIEVDGGIKVDNIAQIVAAGADAIIAGSAIFNSNNYAQVISQMRQEVSDAATIEVI